MILNIPQYQVFLKTLQKQFFFLLIFPTFIFSQKIFVVDREYNSDLKIFVVEREYNSDLKVFKVEREYNAKGNEGLWFFVDREYSSDKKVFFVDREYNSDLKIFFVDRKYNSGWKNVSKKHLLY